MTRRIGIYPGTFDPIHAGHIAFGTAALRSCGLDEVVFVPEADPRGKPIVTALEHRAAMATGATRPHDGLRALTLKSSRFTVAGTMPELRQLFPDAELLLLIGSDVTRTVSQWEGIEELAGARFIVGMRENDDREEVEAALQQAAARYRLRFDVLDAARTTSHVNSSAIRSGDPSHLPPEIARYVRLNNLYS